MCACVRVQGTNNIPKMADVQDLVDKKVAERVGRDGDIWWAVVNVDSSAKTLRLYDSVEGDLPIADVFNYLLDDQVRP